jgi:hypothetical protein
MVFFESFTALINEYAIAAFNFKVKSLSLIGIP